MLKLCAFSLAALFMKKLKLVILLYTITGGLFIISLMFFLFTVSPLFLNSRLHIPINSLRVVL
jgi:hypothetical protein